MGTTIYVRSAADVPKVKHWAILIFSSIWIPGDERSRTNPGHGYPESSVPSIEYRAFLNREDWEAEVLIFARRNEPNYRAIEVNPVTIETKLTIKIT